MRKLGFGCMRLPLAEAGNFKAVDIAEVERMVDTFLERGFTYFDTAYMYHDFHSECVVREALVERHPRSSFTLATKLPTMFLKAEGDQERIFAEQLSKCGVDYFDYYLLHNLNTANYRTVERFDSFAFAARMKAEGRIRHVGFSFHDSAELLDEILAAHPETEFVQLQINYLDWDNPSIQSHRCYDVARRHGKPDRGDGTGQGRFAGDGSARRRTTLPRRASRPLARLVGDPLCRESGRRNDRSQRHVVDGAAARQHGLHARLPTARRRRTRHGGRSRQKSSTMRSPSPARLAATA